MLNNPKAPSPWKGTGGVATVGLEIVLSIAFGYGLGWFADGKLDTGPWLTVLGTAYGLAAAGRALWRASKAMKKAAEEEERVEGNPRPMRDERDERRDRVEKAEARAKAEVFADGARKKSPKKKA